MLGIAKAAQYAGWAGGDPTAFLTGKATVSQVVSQTPAFSWLANGGGNDCQLNQDASVSIDLTGYSSNAGYEQNYTWTTVQTVYLPWAGGLADGDYYSIATELNNNGPVIYNNFNIQIYSGSLSILGGLAYYRTTLPGTYDLYTDRWLTIINCSASSSSAYTSWTGTGFGNSYQRRAIYDTETGELLLKYDTQQNTTALALNSLPSTIGSGFGTNEMFIGAFNPGANSETVRFANWWTSYGTMFDPLAQTSRSFLTTRIPQTVGQGVAWVNPNFTTTTDDGSNYWLNEHSDLVTQASDEIFLLTTGGSAAYATNASTTIIPKDIS
jgi:hypothetical protein